VGLVENAKAIPWWGWVAGLLIIVVIYMAMKKRSSASTSTATLPSTSSVADPLQAGADTSNLNSAFSSIDQWMQGVNQADTQMQAAIAALQAKSPDAAAGNVSQPTSPNGYQASIGQFYQDILGRQEDSNGATYWNGLANTVSTYPLFQQFASTTEARSHAQSDPYGTVTGWYQVLLNRRPNQSEANYWVNRLQTAGLSGYNGVLNGPSGFVPAAQKELNLSNVPVTA
jgi:hypothetical protein